MADPQMHEYEVSASSKRPSAPAYGSSKRSRFGSEDSGSPLAPGELRPAIGEVRFEDAYAAEQALQRSGNVFQGKGGSACTITVSLDDRNQDGTRIFIHNLPHETVWQEVKDYFADCGRIAYTGVSGGKGALPAIAEVRYEDPAHAQLAISLFNGRVVEGYRIEVKTHGSSKDGSKLQVFGLPPDTDWQELKDWFTQAGNVIFVDVVTKEKLPPGAVRIGEVRYADPSHAQTAVSELNGSLLGGREIQVDFDMNSPDGSKLEVRNIPIGIEWQELKDHMQKIGPVAYTQVRTIGQYGELLQVRKGKGKHKGAPMSFSPMMHDAGYAGYADPATGYGSSMGHLVSAYESRWAMPMAGSNGKGVSHNEYSNGKGVSHNEYYGGGNVSAPSKRPAAPVFGASKRARFGSEDSGSPVAPGELRPAIGEIRFDAPYAAEQALQMSGNVFQGKSGSTSEITVSLDDRNQDGTRIFIHNLPHETEWQEVKDYFASCGRIAYAGVIGGKGAKPAIAEVRYEDPAHAQYAISLFNGRVIEGYQIEVKTHGSSKDGAKLQVFGLPPDTDWQELKDWFAQAGNVIFVDIVTKEKLPPGAVRIGEVRYADASHAQLAVAQLNGSLLGGREISVDFDMNSVDGSTLEVRDIPIGIEWQDLKEHFLTVGPVVFTQVRTIGQHGELLQTRKGKGKGKGAPMPLSPMMHDAGYPSSMGYPPVSAYEARWAPPMASGGFAGDPGGYYGPGSPAPFGDKRGEVRYEQAFMAQSAIEQMNGTLLNGCQIEVRKDMLCHDGSRVLISGLSHRTSWQDLKDYFGACGRVMFADIKGQKGGKGKK